MNKYTGRVRWVRATQEDHVPLARWGIHTVKLQQEIEVGRITRDNGSVTVLHEWEDVLVADVPSQGVPTNERSV